MALRPAMLAYLDEHRAATRRYSELLSKDPLMGVRTIYQETCKTAAQKQTMIKALLEDADAHILLSIRKAFPPGAPIRKLTSTNGPINTRGAFLCEFRSVTHLSEFAVGTRKSVMDQENSAEREVLPLAWRPFNEVCKWIDGRGADPETHSVLASECFPAKQQFIVYRCCSFDEGKKNVLSISIETWPVSAKEKQLESAFEAFKNAVTIKHPQSAWNDDEDDGFDEHDHDSSSKHGEEKNPRTVLTRNQRKRQQKKRALARKQLSAEPLKFEQCGYPMIKNVANQEELKEAIAQALDPQPGEV